MLQVTTPLTPLVKVAKGTLGFAVEAIMCGEGVTT